MAFTNTSPIMFPTRSSKAALGTNPMTLAAKATKDTFVLDMATTTVAVGKVRCNFSFKHFYSSVEFSEHVKPY